MAQQQVGGGSTQVTVALIGVVGVLGAALVGNWDKFAGHAAAAITATPRMAEAGPATAPVPALSPSSSPSATASAGPVAVAATTASVEAMGVAQARAFDAGRAALDQVASKIEAASAPELTGLWRDTDGYAYRVAQQGDRFAYIQYQNNVAVGAGGGTLAGHTLDYRFSGPAGSGLCRAMVAPAGDSIAGQCSAGGTPWNFEVTRATGA